jgi:hypothetical protein
MPTRTLCVWLSAAELGPRWGIAVIGSPISSPIGDLISRVGTWKRLIFGGPRCEHQHRRADAIIGAADIRIELPVAQIQHRFVYRFCARRSLSSMQTNGSAKKSGVPLKCRRKSW